MEFSSIQRGGISILLKAPSFLLTLPYPCPPQPEKMWAILAVMVLFSDGVGDIRRLLECVRSPRSELPVVEVTEVLYCMATLLFAMRDRSIPITNRSGASQSIPATPRDASHPPSLLRAWPWTLSGMRQLRLLWEFHSQGLTTLPVRNCFPISHCPCPLAVGIHSLLSCHSFQDTIFPKKTPIVPQNKSRISRNFLLSSNNFTLLLPPRN